jgi:hypothetical protein
MKYVVLLVVCLLYTSTQAIDIHHCSAVVENDRYIVKLDVVIQAPIDRVYSILTDYSNFHQLNESFIESDLLKRIDSTHIKTRLMTESCVLLFCFHAVFVYVIEESGGAEMIARIDPTMSDLSYGESRMRLSSIGKAQTRVQFDAVNQPSFWIPPLIGPWLLKSRMMEEVKETFEKVEEFAQRD